MLFGKIIFLKELICPYKRYDESTTVRHKSDKLSSCSCLCRLRMLNQARDLEDRASLKGVRSLQPMAQRDVTLYLGFFLITLTKQDFHWLV